LVKRLWQLARGLTESHPYAWALAWKAAHVLPFLSPHERSYLGFRHFATGGKGLFLDIGANDGISALSFRKIDPHFDILSLEPNPCHEAALERLKASLGRFDFRLVGAGESPGSFTLHSPIWRGIRLHTFAAGSAEAVRQGLAISFGNSVAREARIESATAPIVTVDQLGLDPRIIKIDAEGYELAIIRGAQATLARCRPVLLFEAWCIDADALRPIFEELGYVTASYDDATDLFQSAILSRVAHDAQTRNLYAIPKERFAGLAR